MKIYIASSFSLIPKVENACKLLEDAGHKITVKWWDRAFDTPTEGPVHTRELKERYANLEPDDFYSRPECGIAYESDFNGVMDSDVLLFVADDEPRAYNGANIELGIALGNAKRCLSVGRLENSALYWNVYRCKDMDEVLEMLGLVEKHGVLKNRTSLLTPSKEAST